MPAISSARSVSLRPRASLVSQLPAAAGTCPAISSAPTPRRYPPCLALSMADTLRGPMAECQYDSAVPSHDAARLHESCRGSLATRVAPADDDLLVVHVEPGGLGHPLDGVCPQREHARSRPLGAAVHVCNKIGP